MAKDELDQELDFDTDINTDLDFDFDGFGDEFEDKEVNKDDRSPKTILKKVKSSAKELYDDGALGRAMEEALPESLKRDYGELEGYYSSTKSMFDDATREAAKSINQLKKSTSKLFPYYEKQINSVIGDKYTGKLKSLINNYEEKRKEESEESLQAAAINDTLNSIFERQEKQEQIEGTRNVIRDQVEAKRFESQQDLLYGIRKATYSLNEYQDQITAKYQRKHLELQHRQLFIQGNIYKAIVESSAHQKTALDAITKNTALPDIVKSKKTEVIKDIGLRNMVNFAGNTFKKYASGFKDQLLKNIQSQVKSATSTFTTMADMGTMMVDMQTMQEEMDSEFGTQQSIGQRIGKWGAQKLLNMSGKAYGVGVARDSRVGGLLSKLSNFVSNLPVEANRFKQDYDGDNFAMQFIRDLLPGFQETTAKQDFGGHDKLRELAQFDIATRKSIVDIIPSLLSKIHQSIEGVRTGNRGALDDDQLLEWDHDSATLTSRQTLDKKFIEAYNNKSNTKQQYNYAIDIVNTIDQDNVLSYQAKKLFAREITLRAGRGRGFDPKDYIEGRRWKVKVSPYEESHKTQIINFLKELYGLSQDENGKVVVDPSKAKDLELQNRLGKAQRYGRTIEEIGSAGTEFQYNRSLNSDTDIARQARLNLATMKDGIYETNKRDNIYSNERVLKASRQFTRKDIDKARDYLSARMVISQEDFVKRKEYDPVTRTVPNIFKDKGYLKEKDRLTFQELNKALEDDYLRKIDPEFSGGFRKRFSSIDDESNFTDKFLGSKDNRNHLGKFTDAVSKRVTRVKTSLGNFFDKLTGGGADGIIFVYDLITERGVKGAAQELTNQGIDKANKVVDTVKDIVESDKGQQFLNDVKALPAKVQGKVTETADDLQKEFEEYSKDPDAWVASKRDDLNSMAEKAKATVTSRVNEGRTILTNQVNEVKEKGFKQYSQDVASQAKEKGAQALSSLANTSTVQSVLNSEEAQIARDAYNDGKAKLNAFTEKHEEKINKTKDTLTELKDKAEREASKVSGELNNRRGRLKRFVEKHRGKWKLDWGERKAKLIEKWSNKFYEYKNKNPEEFIEDLTEAYRDLSSETVEEINRTIQEGPERIVEKLKEYDLPINVQDATEVIQTLRRAGSPLLDNEYFISTKDKARQIKTASIASTKSFFGNVADRVKNKTRKRGEHRIEDVYVDSETEPRILAALLKLRDHYFHAEGPYKGEPLIYTGDIKGPIRDKDGNIVLSETDLEKGIYNVYDEEIWTPYRNGMTKEIQTLDKKILSKVYDVVGATMRTTDVYTKDDLETPKLSRWGMMMLKYVDENGKPIKDVKDIKGPVYDKQGNVLITREQLQQGLCDKHGRPLKGYFIRRLRWAGDMTKSLLKGAKWLSDKTGLTGATKFAGRLGGGILKNTAGLLGSTVLDSLPGGAEKAIRAGGSNTSTSSKLLGAILGKTMLGSLFKQQKSEDAYLKRQKQQQAIRDQEKAQDDATKARREEHEKDQEKRRNEKPKKKGILDYLKDWFPMLFSLVGGVASVLGVIGSGIGGLVSLVGSIGSFLFPGMASLAGGVLKSVGSLLGIGKGAGAAANAAKTVNTAKNASRFGKFAKGAWKFAKKGGKLGLLAGAAYGLTSLFGSGDAQAAEQPGGENPYTPEAYRNSLNDEVQQKLEEDKPITDRELATQQRQQAEDPTETILDKALNYGNTALAVGTVATAKKAMTGSLAKAATKIGGEVVGKQVANQAMKQGVKTIGTTIAKQVVTKGALRVGGRVALAALGPIGAAIMIAWSAWDIGSMIWDWFTSPTKPDDYRIAGYGVNPKNSQRSKVILSFEKYVLEKCTFDEKDGKVTIPDLKMEEIMPQFMHGKEGMDIFMKEDPETQAAYVQRWQDWYTNRFVPVFSSFVNAMHSIAPDVKLTEAFGRMWTGDLADGLVYPWARESLLDTGENSPYNIIDDPFYFVEKLEEDPDTAIVDVTAQTVMQYFNIVKEAYMDDEIELRKKDKAKMEAAIENGEAYKSKFAYEKKDGSGEVQGKEPEQGLMSKTLGFLTAPITATVKTVSNLIKGDTAGAKEAFKFTLMGSAIFGIGKLFGLTSEEKISDLKAIRMYLYGLNNLEQSRVSTLTQLENLLIPLVVYNADGIASIKDLDQNELKPIMRKLGWTDDKQDVDDFNTWFKYRFAPVFLGYCSIVQKYKKVQNPLTDAEGFDGALKYDIALAMQDIQTNSNDELVDVWKIKYGPIKGIDPSSDNKVIETHLESLKSKRETKEVKTELPKTVTEDPDKAKPSTSKDTTTNLTGGANGSAGASNKAIDLANDDTGGKLQNRDQYGNVIDPNKENTNNTSINLNQNTATAIGAGSNGASWDGKATAKSKDVAAELVNLVNQQPWSENEKKMFYAQVAHESANLKYLQELGNEAYFKSKDSKYKGGWRYHGRGPIQVTHKYNYEALSKALGIDAVNNPDIIANDPKLNAASAVWWWNTNQGKRVRGQDGQLTTLKQAAETGDILGATKAVNGGTNGLQDRINWFKEYSKGDGPILKMAKEKGVSAALTSTMGENSAGGNAFSGMTASASGSISDSSGNTVSQAGSGTTVDERSRWMYEDDTDGKVTDSDLSKGEGYTAKIGNEGLEDTFKASWDPSDRDRQSNISDSTNNDYISKGTLSGRFEEPYKRASSSLGKFQEQQMKEHDQRYGQDNSQAGNRGQSELGGYSKLMPKADPNLIELGKKSLKPVSGNVVLNGMKPKFMELLYAAVGEWVSKGGEPLGITSAFRTEAEQERLRRENPKNAAKGRSRHQDGIAIDLNNRKVKDTVSGPIDKFFRSGIAEKYGFKRPLLRDRKGNVWEPWHLENIYVGKLGGGSTIKEPQTTMNNEVDVPVNDATRNTPPAAGEMNVNATTPNNDNGQSPSGMISMSHASVGQNGLPPLQIPTASVATNSQPALAQNFSDTSSPVENTAQSTANAVTQTPVEPISPIVTNNAQQTQQDAFQEAYRKQQEQLFTQQSDSADKTHSLLNEQLAVQRSMENYIKRLVEQLESQTMLNGTNVPKPETKTNADIVNQVGQPNPMAYGTMRKVAVGMGVKSAPKIS